MNALQCFFLEFWDMQTRSLESLAPKPQPAGDGKDRQQLLQQLSAGGWCVQLPQVAALHSRKTTFPLLSIHSQYLCHMLAGRSLDTESA